MPEIKTEITINASADKIWEALTDFEAYPQWNPFITKIKGGHKVGETVRFHANVNGRVMKFAAKVRVSEPGKELAWGGPDSALLGLVMAGHHYYRIEKLGKDKCKLVHGEVFSGVVARLLWGKIKQAKGAYVAMNEALKHRVE